MTSRILKSTGTAFAAVLLTFNAHAVEYKAIDAAKSNVAFSYKQMGVGMDGKFKKFSAQLNFDPTKPAAAKATLEISFIEIFSILNNSKMDNIGK